MKTKQRRSDGHGLGIVHVQACNYPCSLMKTKQRRSDGHSRGKVQA